MRRTGHYSNQWDGLWPPTDVGVMEFQRINLVMIVLEEIGMDVIRFLDALSWGDRLAVTGPTTALVIEGVQEKVQGRAPVFYDLVKTAAVPGGGPHLRP